MKQTEDLPMDLGMPCKFSFNRVKRLYTGGSGIDRLRGAASPGDSNFPEDWIASCVKANSKDVPPDHGFSSYERDGRLLSFPDLLKESGPAILGKPHVAAYGSNPGFLSKLLDSAMRLPLQVHPDRETAKRLFHSPFGKTEAWIVFATREIKGERPYILLGFNETLDDAVFRRESEEGDYKRGLSMLHKFEVSPGDVYVVHGRLPHAIGPGVTMVEVMEPTDITINPERVCCDFELPLERRFAKLSPKDALDVFDYVPRSREETLKLCRPEPELVEKRGQGLLTRRIARDVFKFFEAQELSVEGRWLLNLDERSFRVGIVVSGEVKAGPLSLKGGDSFFIPYDCGECVLEGSAKIVFLLPPKP
jgi:mannose-6-phosphate isomerase